MEPIVTYSERRLDGRRQFSLFPNEVLIAGSSIYGAHFESRFALASIEPTVSRLWIRSGVFLFGATMVGVSALICLILASLPPVVSWAYWPVWVIIATGVAGAVLLGFSFRKIEFASFRGQAGVIVLDVARSGPDRHRFDSFVAALVQQIQLARGVAQSTAPNAVPPAAPVDKSTVTEGPPPVS